MRPYIRSQKGYLTDIPYWCSCVYLYPFNKFISICSYKIYLLMSTLTEYLMKYQLSIFLQGSAEENHEQDTREKETEQQQRQQRHRSKDGSPRVSSPTLAELNAEEASKPKRPALSSYPFSPPSGIPPHYSSPVSDSSSSSHPLPRVAFAEREGYDDLSASFRSLYRSIFGHSVNSGEYINEPRESDNMQQLPTVSSGLSGSNASLPLGASAASLFDPTSRNYSPQFTSLMDSFRDIAESNNWDKLDPAHIQGLMESFKGGEHDKFGLNPEAYSDLASSFNQFLVRLNSRFLTGNSTNSPDLAEYQQHHHSRVAHMMSRGASTSTPKYDHQRESLSPFGMPHVSPPSTSNYHTANSSTSPHISPSGHVVPMCGAMTSTHSHLTPHYSSFAPIHGHASTLTSVAHVGGLTEIPIKSVVTDLFDDAEDDDFDWTKLM